MVTDSESRIIGYVDTSVNQLRADINQRLDRQEQDQRTTQTRIEVKLDQLLDKMVEHFNGAGHPVQTTEIENLKLRIDERIEKPWKMWLWITGAISLLVMLCNFSMGLVGFFVAVAPHLHLKLQ